MPKLKSFIEFGDFQTPLALALDTIDSIKDIHAYSYFIEPTCGEGTFLKVCITRNIEVFRLEGWEINPDYVEKANAALKLLGPADGPIVKEQDFFKINWEALKKKHKDPILFLGNPPWVTNSELGRLLSNNLPDKHNFQNFSGLEALTGKSNFDISEWMLIQLLEYIANTPSSLAFLIKTSVARKLFAYIAKHALRITNISIKEIDSKKHFGVNAHACLFQATGAQFDIPEYACPLFRDIKTETPYSVMGCVDGKLIANLPIYRKNAYLDQGCEFKWRSGVKHDAAKVMEFDYVDNQFVNGLGELANLPWDHLYPMYKSSHISKEIPPLPKYMLIPQKKIGEATDPIERLSPMTWAYLETHSQQLGQRKSTIYKNAPRFAVFGVGTYTFSSWKIVISGLYKNLRFSKIGSYRGKPIVVDDTCYLLSFDSEAQADFVLEMLNSELCKRFLHSIIFLDNKRPITVTLLNRISIKALATNLDRLDQYQILFPTQNSQ